MSGSNTERRMIENEVFFRQHNEHMQQALEDIKAVAVEDDQQPFVAVEDEPLYYYCECSDENCRERILLKPSRYDEIHKQRDQFVIVSGHEAVAIERVVERGPDFWVVEKYINPPKSAKGLQSTDIDNS